MNLNEKKIAKKVIKLIVALKKSSNTDLMLLRCLITYITNNRIFKGSYSNDDYFALYESIVSNPTLRALLNK